MAVPTTAPASVVALVLLAGVLHATWNALAKAIEDKLLAFALLGAGLTVLSAIALPFTGLPARDGVLLAILSTVVHIAYEIGLIQCYRLGAFGHTYPIARGTSPLLVAAGAYLFASETLRPVQLLGVLVVAVGLMLLVLVGGRLTRSELPATLAAVGTGVAIASYTVIDGLGVRHSGGNSVGYTVLLFLLQGPIMPAVLLFWRAEPITLLRGLDRRTWTLGLAAGPISFAAYGIVIWAQGHAPLAVVSALRETSVIVGAVIGAVAFHERFGWQRVLPAVTVVIGIALINA